MIKMKSPIFYMGNKFRLLDQIKELLPNKINTFFDIFGGSGVMAINMKNRAEKVHYNEINKWIRNLFLFYYEVDTKTIIDKTIELANKWKLPINLHMDSEELKSIENKKNKENWSSMIEEFYNDEKKRKNTFIHHFIKQFSFCHQLDFNDDGFKKEHFGSSTVNPKLLIQKIENLKSVKNLTTTNKSFTDFIGLNFDKNDFIYLDPPYYNTNARYSDTWNFELEIKLLSWLDELSKQGIKWALSNVFTHKGSENTHLKKWVDKNKYFVKKPKISYNMNGRSKEESNTTIEVLILNYDPFKESDYTEQLSLDLKI